MKKTVSVIHTIINTVGFDKERLALTRIFEAQPHLKNEEVHKTYELTLQHIQRKLSFDELANALKLQSVTV